MLDEVGLVQLALVLLLQALHVDPTALIGLLVIALDNIQSNVPFSNLSLSPGKSLPGKSGRLENGTLDWMFSKEISNKITSKPIRSFGSPLHSSIFMAVSCDIHTQSCSMGYSA